MLMQLNRILKATALGSLLALVVTGPAHAVDGVIEINQVRAKAGGVTPGDTPLFPVTISQPGSYRLTGNLDVTDASARPGGTLAENTTAILVTVDDVTIDLNGFMIKGPAACSGLPPTCTPTGTGIGVDALNHNGAAVVNGTVRGMGSNGLALDNQSQAEKIRALGNGGTGIRAETVANSTASGNGNEGIFAANTVANCTANINGSDGIFGDTVTGCTADGNGGVGIHGTTASGCTAAGNTASQIIATGVTCHNICAGSPCPGVCP
jgi:parallel beta-helix repeat protein